MNPLDEVTQPFVRAPAEPGSVDTPWVVQDEDILGPADEDPPQPRPIKPVLPAIYSAMDEFFTLFPERRVAKAEFFRLSRILLQRAKEKALLFQDLVQILQSLAGIPATNKPRDPYERYFFSKFPAPEPARPPVKESLVPEDNAF